MPGAAVGPARKGDAPYVDAAQLQLRVTAALGRHPGYFKCDVLALLNKAQTCLPTQFGWGASGATESACSTAGLSLGR